MEEQLFDLQLYTATENNAPVIVYVTGKGMSNPRELVEKACNAAGQVISIAVVTAEDWDNDLTPWSCENIFKGRSFGGRGKAFLVQLLTELQDRLAVECPKHGPIYIAGYSLAGLFAIWALYESNLFAGAVSGSGSLWYPGWIEYAKGKKFDRKVSVYLSLGKAEPKTKHPLMKQVGDITEQQYELFRQDVNVERTVFEWNEGNHFTEPEERMCRGIAWLVNYAE